MTSPDVRSLWRKILSEEQGSQRRFDSHPLRLHYGSDAIGRPIFLLRTARIPPDLMSSDAVLVEVRERSEFGEWLLLFTLADQIYSETFMDLCIDLANRSAEESDESMALEAFYVALQQFHDLFAKRKSRGLSGSELRGLVAELWFAVRDLAVDLGRTGAILAWKGPLGAPQDFRLESGDLIEIKAIHAESRTVRVSSPEQLDPVDAAGMYLTTIVLEECETGIQDAVSLPLLVDEFRSGMAPADQGCLDERLDALHVLATFRNYPQRFLVPAVRHYGVVEGFPRVRRSSIPIGVDKVSYRLKTQAIESFEVSDLPTRTQEPDQKAK